jgi:nitrite reductase/ring-hydroxylating ferredoxin subunit
MMSEINKSWIRVCALDTLPADKASDLNINGQRLIITRCGDDVTIFQGFCSHMFFPLAGSNVENCVLTCSLHHSKFDARDGSVVEWSTFPPLVGKALAAIRARKSLRTFETRVNDGSVYVLWTTDNPDEVHVHV